MIIIVMLIAISLVIALIFLGVFFWSIRSGQYEDLYTPSVRMLFDEGKPAEVEKRVADKAESEL